MYEYIIYDPLERVVDVGVDVGAMTFSNGKKSFIHLSTWKVKHGSLGTEFCHMTCSK